MSHRVFSSERGMALVTALLFITLALVVLGALSIRLVGQTHVVGHYEGYKGCFQGLEAALALSVHELENGQDGAVGLADWPPTYHNDGTIVAPDFDSDTVSPVSSPSMPQVEYMAYAVNWSDDQRDNNGDGLVDEPGEWGFFTVYAFSRTPAASRSLEAVYSSADMNVWNNAIFAGAGHVAGAVQGNCSIHGSVHILGDDIVEGGEAVVVLDMMGASLIHNNYGIGPGPGPALPDRLRDSVPPLPQTLVDGELVDTLNATLRVKHGLVSLNSAAEVGEENIPGNSQKETMDGTYVTDGWDGTRVADDGGRGDPSVVYSDNGWDEVYDLGDRVPMPMLSDVWRWPSVLNDWELGYEYNPPPGSTEPSPDGDNYLHGEFFSDVLSDGAAYNGNVVIENDTDFYLNLSRPGDPDPDHRVRPDPASLTPGDDYLYYDSSTHVLEINGQIEIDGDFEIKVGKKGASEPSIYYTGRAAILAHGNVAINADLFTCNDGNPDDYVNSFPQKNCIGIMAEQDLRMGDSAQLDLMGAFYAQGSITSKKQSLVMGSFVATWFDMGSQVPDIFQVPELVHNLPLGMIGNYPILTFSRESWRELGG